MSSRDSTLEHRHLLEIGLLGPLSVTMDGTPVDLMPGRPRALLATLAISTGRSVSAERLGRALWGDDLPAHPRQAVQTYVTRLRRVVGARWIRTTPSGYLLDVRPDQVDVQRFLRLLDDAASAATPVARRAHYVQATCLWRGTPFEDVQSPWLEQFEAPSLWERYLSAVERRIDIDIADGRCADRVAELSDLTVRFPLRESLWLRYLTVLDRCGRRAEALNRYGWVRAHLADELGAEPGPELRQIHADLLATRSSTVRTQRAPRHLPADLPTFTGRTDVLAALDKQLSDRTAPVIVALHGAAGVGKSTLAVHWAHRVSDEFVDGQIHVDLSGPRPLGPDASPVDDLTILLDSLGVPVRRIPAHRAGRLGLYRALMADRNILVILDNARNAVHVRDLLPTGPHCVAIVTSRDQLLGLFTAAARPVAVPLFTDDESRELLHRVLGPDRLHGQARAVHDVVERCAGLPLALSAVAARAATHPDFSLTAIAAELLGAERTLDTFSTADPATDLRAVFSSSYRTLSIDAAHLFRLLAVHTGSDITEATGTQLIGLPAPQVRNLLTELARIHLIDEYEPHQHRLHSLLRAYARELLESHRNS